MTFFKLKTFGLDAVMKPMDHDVNPVKTPENFQVFFQKSWRIMINEYYFQSLMF